MNGDFTRASDPISLFAEWFGEAEASEPVDPNAMSLATVDGDGLPNVRTILLKGFDADGFVFFTNLNSTKGAELGANPRAALCFYWKSLGRQVRARGPVTPVSAAEADAYFATRARGSRIGAWASRQSEPLESRAVLEEAVASFTEKFGDGDILRPENWSGFRLEPLEIEFWRAGKFRLHDRVRFTRAGEGWEKTLLYP
jgi:pyridoxamine 5'-phosphate oxidase